jgi:hypothetical protein
MEESGICDAFSPTIQNGMPLLLDDGYGTLPVLTARKIALNSHKDC